MKAINEEMPTTTSPLPVYSDLYPLDEFYAERGDAAPIIDRIGADEIPAEYRFLLDNNTDMTSTLENFYAETLHLEVLAWDVRETEYRRAVALVLDLAGTRVEFGAITINIGIFPAEARREILFAQQPLGRILNRFNIPFASRPRAFLRLMSDSFMDAVLQLQWPQLLYGRRNSLLDEQGRPLAEIVEILPP